MGGACVAELVLGGIDFQSVPAIQFMKAGILEWPDVFFVNMSITIMAGLGFASLLTLLLVQVFPQFLGFIALFLLAIQVGETFRFEIDGIGETEMTLAA